MHNFLDLLKERVMAEVYCNRLYMYKSRHSFVSKVNIYYVIELFQRKKDPCLFSDNKINVRISMDGAKYSRSSNFCTLFLA